MIIKVQKKKQNIILIIDQRQPSHTQRTSGILQVFWLQKGLSFHSKYAKKRRIYIKINKEEKEENRRTLFLVQLAQSSYFSE